jgi:DNA-binding Lrp family transcriptional regulator
MVDDTDNKIISMLKNDGRISFVDIAKQIGLTEGAVRARVSKLTKSGAIKRFTVDTRDDVKALVMVATSRSVSTSKVAEAIKAHLGIDKTYEISGNFDIVCLVESNSIENVNSMVEKIRAIEGVTDTSTSMVLK